MLRERSVLVALIVSCAFFMQQLDSTAIATALPQMARSLHDTPVNLSIGLTVYLLTLAVFIPSSGWMADRFGSRSVFVAAIAIFTLGSILCGISGSLWQFVGARILQGIGGAMMVPVGRLIVLRSAQKHELIRSMQFVTIPGLTAPVLGPPVGGLIATYASWRWIFFLNVPIGVVGIALALAFMQDLRAEERRAFDAVGFALSGTGLACLMFGFSAGGRGGTSPALALSVLLAGAVLFALALLHARRHPEPLLNLGPLRYRNFAIATIFGGALFRVTIGATPLLWALLFQTVFGMTAFISGVLMMVCTGGDLAMQAVTRRTLRRFGFRNTMIVNGLICALGVFACMAFSAQGPRALIVGVLLWIGLSRSLQFTALNALGYVDIPPPMMSSATSLASTIQQLSAGVGVAFGAVVLHASSVLRGGSAQSFDVTDFRIAFAAIGLTALISAFNFRRLLPQAGAEVSGHGRPLPAR